MRSVLALVVAPLSARLQRLQDFRFGKSFAGGTVGIGVLAGAVRAERKVLSGVAVVELAVARRAVQA